MFGGVLFGGLGVVWLGVLGWGWSLLGLFSLCCLRVISGVVGLLVSGTVSPSPSSSSSVSPFSGSGDLEQIASVLDSLGRQVSLGLAGVGLLVMLVSWIAVRGR